MGVPPLIQEVLKIVIASSGLGHISRGIEAWADDLASALASREKNVILCKGAGPASRAFERVIPCWQRDSSNARLLLRILPKRLSWRLGLGSSYGIEQTTFALNLLRLLRNEKVDILHVQDPHVALIAHRARRLGIIRTKTILAHGTEEPPSFLRGITYLQHLAPWHLQQVKAAGVWKPMWTAIPNFIDTDLFAPGRSAELRAELGIPAEGLIVLTAAAIKRNHKRIDHLISDFAQLRKAAPDLPAWLVVAGGWETETDSLIAEGTRMLGERVRFLVRFPRHRMPELYRAADVFVLCSLFEMMPIALIEALASGLPCVVNRHPILEWMAGPGGPTIDMNATGVLALVLAELLKHPLERESLGKAARRHCLENFAKNSVLNRILEYYDQIMRSKR